MARLAQIAQRCTPADAVRVVAGNRPDPVRIRRVQVVDVRVAQRPAGVIERRLRRQPVVALKPMADDRPLAAVKIVLEIGIRLHPAKERQRPFIRPFVIAVSRCPVLEILRQPAQKHLPVNRASAARNLAARHKHRLRHIIRLARELPVMLIAHHNIRARSIPILQLLRQPLEIRIIRPRLHQQHRPCPILRQPPRRRRTRRPRPNNHNIILHRLSRSFRIAPSPPVPRTIRQFRGKSMRDLRPKYHLDNTCLNAHISRTQTHPSIPKSFCLLFYKK